MTPGDLVLAALSCALFGGLCVLGFLITGTRAAARTIARHLEKP